MGFWRFGGRGILNVTGMDTSGLERTGEDIFLWKRIDVISEKTPITKPQESKKLQVPGCGGCIRRARQKSENSGSVVVQNVGEGD